MEAYRFPRLPAACFVYTNAHEDCDGVWQDPQERALAHAQDLDHAARQHVRSRASVLIGQAENLRYGYVMQRQNLDTLFPFTVGDIVRMGRLGHKQAWQRTSHEDTALVEEALVVAGIVEIRDNLYRQLYREARGSARSSLGPLRRNRMSCCWTSPRTTWTRRARIRS